MPTSFEALLESLRKRCREQPGATKHELHDDDYTILNDFLGTFAQLHLNESPPVLWVRCRNELLWQIQAAGGNIGVSERMYRPHEGWSTVDAILDGTIPEASLLQLIDESYHVVRDGLHQSDKERLDLFLSDLPLSQLFDKLVDSYGFNRSRAQLDEIARPALLLGTTATPISEPVIGRSRFGGCPDLPEEIAWPTYSDGKPLAFLSQINLANASDVCAIEGLPTTGMLYVFSVFGWQEDGDVDPQLPNGKYQHNWTRVIYHPTHSGLQRRATPTQVNSFPAAEISFTAITTFPTHTKEPAVAKFKWSGDKKEKYDSLISAYNDVSRKRMGSPPRSLLGGYADYEQEFEVLSV